MEDNKVTGTTEEKVDWLKKNVSFEKIVFNSDKLSGVISFKESAIVQYTLASEENTNKRHHGVYMEVTILKPQSEKDPKIKIEFQKDFNANVK